MAAPPTENEPKDRGKRRHGKAKGKGGKAQVPRKQETKQDAPAQKPDPRSLIAGMPEGPMKEAALKAPSDRE